MNPVSAQRVACLDWRPRSMPSAGKARRRTSVAWCALLLLVLFLVASLFSCCYELIDGIVEDLVPRVAEPFLAHDAFVVDQEQGGPAAHAKLLGDRAISAVWA